MKRRNKMSNKQNITPSSLENLSEKSSSRINDFLTEVRYFFATNKLAFIGFLIISLLIVLAILAPIIVPYPQDISAETNLQSKFLAPSWEHFFGTDELGRDLFSRVIY